MGLPHQTSSKVMGRFKTPFIAFFLGCQGLFLMPTVEASSAEISSQFERGGYDPALGRDEEQGQASQMKTEDGDGLEDEYAMIKRNFDETISHSGWKRQPYGYGLGKRDPYGYGLGKRDPYGYGLGKRQPYGYGLGKRDPYGYGLGKGNHMATDWENETLMVMVLEKGSPTAM